MSNHAELLMNATFAALEDPSVRWFADEHGVERCQFLRPEDDLIVVWWCGRECKVDPRRLFCNPEDARIEHEILADKARARIYNAKEE